MSRLALVAMDTRGGVQPYFALALGLQRAGHDVRVIAPEDFQSVGAKLGLAVHPTSGSMEDVLRLTRGVAERGALATMRLAKVETARRMRLWAGEVLEGARGSELMLGGVGGMIAGLSVADKLGIPFLEAHLQPIGQATREFPGVLLPKFPSLFGLGTRLGHFLSEQGIWAPFRSAMRVARREVLGLDGDARVSTTLPVLYGVSPEVVPQPADWDARRHLVGYWNLPGTDWNPPEALTRFLAAGDRPVCIGFGSMAAQDPQALSELVLEATKRAGVRAVLLSGWGGLANLERDDVLVLPEAPHDWLLPRMAAVVHHGGAGTTGAGLTAGIPSIVVPFTMDQPFWGERVFALGAGPRPIPRSALTVERLAERLRAATTDPAMSDRARQLGERLRAEDGVGRAVALIGEVLGSSRKLAEG